MSGGGGGMQRGDYLQTAGARSRKRRGGQVFSWEHVISQAVWGEGGESRRGRGRKDRHSLTQQPKLSPTTAGHFSGTFSSGWGSERAGGGRGQPLSNVDSVVTKRREASLRLEHVSRRVGRHSETSAVTSRSRNTCGCVVVCVFMLKRRRF